MIRSQRLRPLWRSLDRLTSWSVLSLSHTANATYNYIPKVANAGISERTRLSNVQLGDDGKPLKPELPTIEVNLIGTAYSVSS
jgi:hypothetical protein